MNKKRIAILAPLGMLGSQVYNVLKDNYDLVLVFRDEQKLQLLDSVYGGIKNHKLINFDLDSIYKDYLGGFPNQHISPKAQELFELIGEVDAVINCAGIIKQKGDIAPEKMLFINGALPYILSQQYKEKLIHITTDCVFSGIEGAPYDEQSQKSPNDLYGISKLMGEPFEKSLVLRTSIVGPELGSGVSLLGWFLKQEGKTISGYTNHFWNGVTTKEFAKICERIITDRKSFPKTGLFHIYGSDVNKYEMLLAFKEKYKINVAIEPKEVTKVDRRLATVFDLCEKLQIPNFEEMVKDL